MSSTRALIHAHTEEKEWQAHVVEWATAMGWHCYHAHDSRHSPSGWPDLFLVRGKEKLAIECKTQRGPVSGAQWEWVYWLRDAGIPAFVARPSDEEFVKRALGMIP